MGKHRVSKPVQKLVDLGVCSTSDVMDAISEAEKLSTQQFQNKIRHVERLFGTVGEANRVRILLLLSKHEMCVCELEYALKLPQPTISHHLTLLEHSGLVERNKKARWVFYRLLDSPITGLLRSMVL